MKMECPSKMRLIHLIQRFGTATSPKVKDSKLVPHGFNLKHFYLIKPSILLNLHWVIIEILNIIVILEGCHEGAIYTSHRALRYYNMSPHLACFRLG